MNRFRRCLAGGLLCLLASAAVEGGQATLIVTPQRIDYLVVTHFHRDHIGGIPELAQLVPVGTFIDHGSA